MISSIVSHSSMASAGIFKPFASCFDMWRTKEYPLRGSAIPPLLGSLIIGQKSFVPSPVIQVQCYEIVICNKMKRHLGGCLSFDRLEFLIHSSEMSLPA